MSVYENQDARHEQQVETRSLLEQASPVESFLYQAMGNEVVGPLVTTADVLIRSIAGRIVDMACGVLKRDN